MNTFEQASDKLNKGHMGGENVIEWLNNMERATLSFSQGRYVSKVRKLAEEHPDEVQIVADYGNEIVAHIPSKWIKVAPPRKVSDEQKAAAAERFKQMWKEKADAQ